MQVYCKRLEKSILKCWTSWVVSDIFRQYKVRPLQNGELGNSLDKMLKNEKDQILRRPYVYWDTTYEHGTQFQSIKSLWSQQLDKHNKRCDFFNRSINVVVMFHIP